MGQVADRIQKLDKGKAEENGTRIGANRDTVDTWEIKRNQELPHTLKIPTDVRLPPLADLWALWRQEKKAKEEASVAWVSAGGMLQLRAELQREHSMFFFLALGCKDLCQFSG